MNDVVEIIADKSQMPGPFGGPIEQLALTPGGPVAIDQCAGYVHGLKSYIGGWVADNSIDHALVSIWARATGTAARTFGDAFLAHWNDGEPLVLSGRFVLQVLIGDESARVPLDMLRARGEGHVNGRVELERAIP
jgi:hypothetical protein